MLISLAPSTIIPAARAVEAVLAASGAPTELVQAAAGAIVGLSGVLGIPMCRELGTPCTFILRI